MQYDNDILLYTLTLLSTTQASVNNISASITVYVLFHSVTRRAYNYDAFKTYNFAWY